MVSTDSASNIVGIVGIVITFCLFLSPLPTIVTICKNRSVTNFSPTPYLTSCCKYVIGVLYGLPWVKPDNLLVLVVSGVGIGIELMYIIIFMVFANNKKQRIRILLVVVIEIIFIVILCACIFTVLHTTAEKTMAVGIIGVLFSIGMYASPLSVMQMVIRSKSVEYMPLSISLASLLCSAVWTAYAALRCDLYLLIANGIGVIVSLVQLLLYAIYFKSTRRQLAAREEQEAEGGMIRIKI